MKIIQSKLEAIPFFFNPEHNGVSAKKWIMEQPRNKWISILIIPNEIFFSIWNDLIETKACILHSDKSLFKIL